MNRIVLADESGGVLLSVSGEDWSLIGQRVDAAISLSGIAREVTQYLPGFEALVEACQGWKGQTWPAVSAGAQSLADYCDLAITGFQEVRKAVSGPLTPAVRKMVTDALAALSARTTPLNDQFHRLSSRVTDFAEINNAVDTEVDKYVARLGQDWRSILPQTSRVDDAASRMRGAWQALSADLGALVSQPIDVTEQFIVSLEIDEALLGWTSLRSRARAFLAQHGARMPA